MVSLKTKILTEGKFWLTNFTKNCFKWSTKRQSWFANCGLQIANSNPTLDKAIKTMLEIVYQSSFLKLREDKRKCFNWHWWKELIDINLIRTHWESNFRTSSRSSVEICSKFTMNTLKWCHRWLSVALFLNLKHSLVLLLLAKHILPDRKLHTYYTYLLAVLYNHCI